MRKEDKFALEINKILREDYNLLSKKVGPYSNLIGIFYHQIIIYTTNYYLIKNSKYEYDQKIAFPYLNTKYCNNPFIIPFNKLEKIHKYGWKNHVLLSLIRMRKISTIFIDKKTQGRIITS